MTKYIDADKLIAEIKGIIAAVHTTNHPDVLGTMEQCMAAAEIEALDLVLDAIKGLQQELPEVGLNEETITNAFRVIEDKCFNEGIEGWQREKLIARHFYALGVLKASWYA